MATNDSVNQLAHSQNTNYSSVLRILAQNKAGWPTMQDRRKDSGLQQQEKENKLPLLSKLHNCKLPSQKCHFPFLTIKV